MNKLLFLGCCLILLAAACSEAKPASTLAPTSPTAVVGDGYTIKPIQTAADVPGDGHVTYDLDIVPLSNGQPVKDLFIIPNQSEVAVHLGLQFSQPPPPVGNFMGIKTDATLSAYITDPTAKVVCNNSGCDSCVLVNVPPHSFAQVPFLAHGDHGHRGAVYDVPYDVTVLAGSDVSCISDNGSVWVTGGSEYMQDKVRIILGTLDNL